MSVKIEIIADNGYLAAHELKQLADGLAVMGLVQQHLAGPQQMHGTPVPQPAPAAQSVAVEQPKQQTEPDKEPAEKVDQPAPSAAVQKLLEEHSLDAADIPATGAKGRLLKSDVEKYIQDNAPVKLADDPEPEKADGAPEENPDPYRLFDEDGKEEELFDTPEAYLTALTSMFDDAPDAMTLEAVGKSNEETVRRLVEEEVDISALIEFFKKQKATLDTAETKVESAEPAAEEAEAKPETQPEAEGPTEKTPTIDDVRAAIKQLASAKGVPVAGEVLGKFDAKKAGEVKDEDRAAFIKAAAEAAGA